MDGSPPTVDINWVTAAWVTAIVTLFAAAAKGIQWSIEHRVRARATWLIRDSRRARRWADDLLTLGNVVSLRFEELLTGDSMVDAVVLNFDPESSFQHHVADGRIEFRITGLSFDEQLRSTEVFLTSLPWATWIEDGRRNRDFSGAVDLVLLRRWARAHPRRPEIQAVLGRYATRMPQARLARVTEWAALLEAAQIESDATGNAAAVSAHHAREAVWRMLAGKAHAARKIETRASASAAKPRNRRARRRGRR